MNPLQKITRRQSLLGMGASLGVCLTSGSWLKLGIAEAAEKEDFGEIDHRLHLLADKAPAADD